MGTKIFKKILSVLLVFSLVVPNFLLNIGTTVSAAEISSQQSETITVAEDLLISEYVEGSSFNKAIEIFNGTGEDVDLSNYSLELYTNGKETVQTTAELSGTLANGEVYVIYHPQAKNEIKAHGDLSSNVVNFNGDDAVVLKNNGEIIDSVGQIPDRVENLKDVTLVRNSDIAQGDTNPYDIFDPSLEWTTYPRDTFDYLGSHTMGGTTPETPEEPGDEPTDPKTPVEAITIAEARALVGQEVTVEAIATTGTGFWGGQGFYIQDETAGIYVFPKSANVEPGDKVRVTGPVSEYNTELQIQATTVEVITSDNNLPETQVIEPLGVNAEIQGELVKIENVTITELTEYNYGTFEFVAIAENGEKVLVRHDNRTGSDYDEFLNYYKEGDLVHVTGIASVFRGTFQIKTLGLDSYELVNKPAVYTSVLPGTVAKDTKVELISGWENADIYYTLDGSTPTPDSTKYNEAIVLEKDTTIKAIAVMEEQISDVFTFKYTIIDLDDIRIHDIQGASHESPLVGEKVADVEGVVTYTFKIGSGNYFTMQTPDDQQDNNPKTSEGIIVYLGNQKAPKVGSLVKVTGTVDEYYIDGYYDTKQDTDLPVTQINARDDRGGAVTVIDENVELPKPVKITSENLPNEVIDNDSFTEFDPEEDAIDFWESLEGMLVEVDTVKAVAPQEHGDLITVLEERETDTIHGGVLLTEDNANPDRIQFKMYDNSAARDFEVATGDKFTGPITGVVSYGFQNYNIYVDLEVMQEAHVEGDAEPETTTIEKADDKLTIASYNLENFSSETSADKAQKLARAFVQDMESPDIIGVTEVQDNNGPKAGDSAADKSYERLIDFIEAAGGPRYEYLNIDPENNKDGGQPNANIRVGFLYNPERVTIPEGIPAGDATTAVEYKNGKLTHNPGRIDPNNPAFDSSRKPLAAQFNFQGEDVIVIVNHWNSKSGDTPLFGSTQPPLYGSEEQRKQIANIVYDFIEEIKEDNPDANIVSVGDFNDFQWSDALKIHEGKLMTNMINYVDPSDRYTYLFQGNSQVLDHILVSNNLVDYTEIDILHINADFTDMAGRASDHDPVMVQIDFEEENEEEPGAGEEDPTSGEGEPGAGEDKPGVGEENPGENKDVEVPGNGEQKPTPSKSPKKDNVKAEGKEHEFKVNVEDLEELDENDTLVVEISNQINAKVSLSREAIKKLKEFNADVVVSNGIVYIQIPSSVLPNGETDIQVKEMYVKETNALAVYDFTIKSDGTTYHQFDKKITLTFNVDHNKVKNAENVKVFYYNEETKKWELVPGGVYKNGQISVDVDHFSTYGVFETEDVPTSEPISKNQSTSNDKEHKGKELPNTATMNFNMMVTGIILISMAVVVYVINRKKVNTIK